MVPTLVASETQSEEDSYRNNKQWELLADRSNVRGCNSSWRGEERL